MKKILFLALLVPFFATSAVYFEQQTTRVARPTAIAKPTVFEKTWGKTKEWVGWFFKPTVVEQGTCSTTSTANCSSGQKCCNPANCEGDCVCIEECGSNGMCGGPCTKTTPK